MKTCTRCKKPYPDELFIGAKGGEVKLCMYCREKDGERKRQYYAANREKVRERKRRYYAANREKLSASQRQYRKANREKHSERKRQYRAANREKIIMSNQRNTEERRKHQANADMEALFPGMLAAQITSNPQ